MSTPPLTARHLTPAVAPAPSPWGTAARIFATSAAALAYASAGATVALSTSSMLATAVGDLSGLVAGLALAVVQGAQVAGRKSHRRLVFIGVFVVVCAVGLHAVSVPVVTGLLLGIGSGMLVLVASAWCEEARLGPIPAVSLGVAAISAGAAVGASGPLAATVTLIAAVATGFAAPDLIDGPRTPLFSLPRLPDLQRHPAVGPALLALVASFSVMSFGAISGLVVAAALGSTIAAAALFPRRRSRNSTHLSASGRSYKRAVSVFDSSASPRPAFAASVHTLGEVRAALETARRRGLTVAMHSTGHAAMGLPDLESSALLKVAIEGPITVDPDRRLVRIPAGRAWGDVVPLAHRHGLALAHGSSERVGVVGYLTRGGLSAYGRRTGVASNWLESIELVTADGEHIVSSRDHEPELFWALRGGGGGFGVVTAVTVRAFRPGDVVTGTALWELEDAAAVADAWARWSVAAPSAITTSLRVLTLPPLPGMPIRLTGRPMLVIDGTAVDHGTAAREAAGDLLSRLREVAIPRLDTWRVADALEVPNTHMDPPFSPAHSSAHTLLGAGDPTDEAQARGIVADFIAAAAHRATGVGIAELRQLGGALAQNPADAGVVGHLRGTFGWLAIALHGKSGREVAETAIDDQLAQMAKWDTGFTAPTLAVERSRPARSFPAALIPNVEAVRRSVDPEGIFAIDVAPGARPLL